MSSSTMSQQGMTNINGGVSTSNHHHHIPTDFNGPINHHIAVVPPMKSNLSSTAANNQQQRATTRTAVQQPHNMSLPLTSTSSSSPCHQFKLDAGKRLECSFLTLQKITPSIKVRVAILNNF